MDEQEIYASVISVVDRSECTFCQRSLEWGNPIRNNKGIDIKKYQRWQHRKNAQEVVPCHVSEDLELRWQEVFGDSNEG